jgi:phenylalanyl-tRNA synthetase beta chain
MSVALGLRTEASTRNEKNLPIALADRGAARAAALLAAEGGTVRAPTPYGQTPEPARAIVLPKGDVARLLGFTVNDAEKSAALVSLGFTVVEQGDALLVTAPPWRSDIAIAADLVEEIARVVGYGRVIAEIPRVALQPLSSAPFERENALATTLAGLGYHEVLTLSLQPAAVAERDRALGFAVPAPVEIRNPLSDDQRYLRYAMLPAHLGLIARDRQRPYRIFEIGHVFSDGEPPNERNVATIVAASAHASEPSWRSTPFLALASDVLAVVRALCGRRAELERAATLHLHPGKTAAIIVDGSRIGVLGVVDPRLLRAYDIEDDVVAATLEVESIPPRTPIIPFRPPSRFPAIERDLALVLDQDVAAADVLELVRAHPDVRGATVFDEYRGAQIDVAKKSLAVRVTLQRDDATLTDAQADTTIVALVADLGGRFGATLRT